MTRFIARIEVGGKIFRVFGRETLQNEQHDVISLVAAEHLRGIVLGIMRRREQRLGTFIVVEITAIFQMSIHRTYHAERIAHDEICLS
jgi:hypothetical protein